MVNKLILVPDKFRKKLMTSLLVRIKRWSTHEMSILMQYRLQLVKIFVCGQTTFKYETLNANAT